MLPSVSPATESAPEGAAELVARILAGAPEAETELVRRYGRPVAIVLDRHTGGRAEAEDLFQDTFRLALEKLRAGQLREPAKLPGFLGHLARNLAIEHYRKTARRRTDGDDDAVSAVVSDRPGPLGQLLDHERAVLARRVVGELANERDREILMRFYLAEEDKDAIAADLGLTGLQFNRVLHRARERYRELYLERLAALGDRHETAAILGAIFVALVPLWLRGERAMMLSG